MCDVYGYGKSSNCSTLRYFDLPWFVEEVIDFKLIGLSQGIMFTYNRQPHHIGCDYKSCDFVCSEAPTFRSIIVGGMRLSDMEWPCAYLCAMSFSQCGWPNWPILGYYTCWFMVYIVWVVHKNCHYLSLWLTIQFKNDYLFGFNFLNFFFKFSDKKNLDGNFVLFKKWHMACLAPPLDYVPVGKWFCPWCT